MVNSTSILFMKISVIVTFLLPIIVFFYFRKKEHIKIKPVLIGAAIFFVFTMILEKTVHKVVLQNNLISNKIVFSIYGAIMAGLFEECGRFIVFKTILKKNHKWKDGIAYGIGHGGIEAIILGGITSIQYVIYSNLINKKVFETILAPKLSKLQMAQLNQLKQSLIQTTPSYVVIGIFERIFAFGIQLALTMVVLYAIRERKNIYLLVAILLHALIDFSAVLYQMKIIPNLFVVESIIALEFVAAVVFLVKTRKKIYGEVN